MKQLTAARAADPKPKRTLGKFRGQLPLHAMMLPGIVTLIIFSYIPMAGIVIAFQKFVPAKGLFGDQKWVGLANFRLMLAMPDSFAILRNTVVIAVGKIVLSIVVSVLVALLMNEIRVLRYKKAVQTVIYMPYFLSWVIFGGILITILSPSEGIVNKLIQALGLDPVFFLGDPKIFPATVIATDVWKNFGMNTIIYLATLTGIDPSLYEASACDGASRLQQAVRISLPGMAPIIMLLTILNIGNILNAGFDQVFILQNPQVMSTGDIIDTFVYRMGLIDLQYGLSTAVGLFKSVISAILIVLSYWLSYKYSDYRVW